LPDYFGILGQKLNMVVKRVEAFSANKMVQHSYFIVYAGWFKDRGFTYAQLIGDVRNRS